MRVAVAGGSGTVGRYVVEAATAAGHAAVVLSRSHGVDLLRPDALGPALAGVDVVIDVTNPSAREGADRFFSEATTNLQTLAAEAGVRHIVTLSIVGIERAAANPYYAAKLRQEQIVLRGPVPATVLRATQFHEFAVQTLARSVEHGRGSVPNMRVQSVAARTVGQVLIEHAAAAAMSRAPDLAGPEQADLVDLARAYVERFDLQLAVEIAPSAIPFGATLPDTSARREGPTFADWLELPDAAGLAVGLRRG
jgi:uncharacterized protein YbjT (DUF2867 family)